MKTICCFFIKTGFLVVLLLISSCASNTVTESYEKKEEIIPVSCVVLLATHPYQDGLVDPDIQQNLIDGAQFLNITVKNHLQRSQVEKIIESSQIGKHMGDVEGGKLGAIKKIGKEAGCSSVLLATMNEFSQRLGGEYAVDAPASVAFDLKLIDSVTGDTLWNTSFNETQTTLLSNLFSFNKAKSRGFKWITAEELTEQGVGEKLVDCPYFFKH